MLVIATLQKTSEAHEDILSVLNKAEQYELSQNQVYKEYSLSKFEWRTVNILRLWYGKETIIQTTNGKTVHAFGKLELQYVTLSTGVAASDDADSSRNTRVLIKNSV